MNKQDKYNKNIITITKQYCIVQRYYGSKGFKSTIKSLYYIN